jgi:threonine dehydrogenase-like Zn-dependent dehydrogenase
MLRGAGQVFMVDRRSHRVRLAESIGRSRLIDANGSSVDR